ncbi:MAG: penicillin acylase family protein [Pseudomonadota bacterium]
MRKFFLRSASALAVLVILIVAYVQVTLMRAEGGLPDWNGDITVDGVQANVVISRDEHGTPHISASSEADLYFAQGFVHAQDRFWQMAITRQTVQVRLSEWLGSMALDGDRLQRMFNWQQVAEDSYAAMSGEERRLLDAYASGVNAWLDSEHYRRPPEMRILHIHPERWTSTDSFIVANSLFLILATTGAESTDAQHRLADLSTDMYDMLSGNTFEAPPIIMSADDEAVRQPSMPVKESTYSNNWTVTGEHTVSGLPLMANDPQLAVSLPNTWQLQAHHLDGTLRAGGTLPGIPGITVGHNGAVAWGITNAVVDAIDLAYLESHPDNPTLYRRGPTRDWESYIERDELIKVRFGADHTETVRHTPKGRIWPDGVPSRSLGSLPGVRLEIRSVFHDAPGKSVAAFMSLNQAESVESAIDAIRDATALALNFSFADVQGDIGYVVSGSIAARDVSHATTVGFYPEDDNEWELLDFAANPKVINPPAGRIVSANQQIIGDAYPHYLSTLWATPYRAWRIHELLDETPKHDVDSFLDMQTDSLSPVARNITPLLLDTEPAGAADALLIEMLAGWDYRFTLDTPAAVVWTTWVTELRNGIFGDKIDGVYPFDYGGLYLPLLQALGGQTPEWCDNTTTDRVEDCDTLLSQSLTKTRLSLEERYGVQSSKWRWGDVGQFRHAHIGFDALPVLGSRFSRLSPIKGGPESMFTNGLSPDEAPSFSTTFFTSSYQGIYDLADLGQSLFMTSGGTSGHFRSSHYDDLTERWLTGDRIKLGEVPNAPSYRLRLRRQNAGDTSDAEIDP